MSSSLQVEGALVLQPSPVAGHTANLLTIVVWRGVCKRRDGGVDTVTLDAVEEGRIFLYDGQYQALAITLSDNAPL